MALRLVDAEDAFFKESKERVEGELEACIDRSKKGGLDEPIVELINMINQQAAFVTTSSCSGRCAIFAEGDEKKKTGQWLLASHEPITFESVSEACSSEGLRSSQGTVMFKFEPVVLHIQCQTLFLARDLLKTALDAGMRQAYQYILSSHSFVEDGLYTINYMAYYEMV
eukprot:m.53473 g.53473  ORF g.53473 m.53473 type:complete len:169 (-) comp12804_c0_seq2:834-1340(-)